MKAGLLSYQEAVTKRQIMRYGDSDGFPNPEVYNLKGKLFVHNDEAGKLAYENYDSIALRF
ncbi:hypothetical protein G3O08_20180 [Cryomorpha ignava]|uniref:Uncharacterized protein n=1 Tax=Cryomorpha ignava TaxID=101383 RepID=A0A7K3WXI1_9FLAO|nr:hypothetical protein [Cryomorpha ignava]NEN25811.1 hypothetical protein [Cryomorpha ignava]